tara:strand:- start:23398 stop:26442 length:3045 start_codon:yes stop_codon:yes gene_type:complete
MNIKSQGLYALVWFLFYLGSVSAEVVFDGSLKPEMAGVFRSDDFTITEADGVVAGSNLFHSFDTFNVNTGESATFTSSTSVDNIISRVTGSDASSIAGILNADSNLYILNPNGVIISDNAAIEVEGVFHPSELGDEYLEFNDDSRFFSTVVNPILSVESPEGFGFLVNHANPIIFDGSTGDAGALLSDGSTEFGNHYTVNQSSGEVKGQNLFHSFGEFNVNTGDEVNFDSGDSIKNIIARVTGGDYSEIDGTIRSDANLWLLNSSGYIFLGKTELQLGFNSSLYVSDTNRISFSGGAEFGVNELGFDNEALGGLDETINGFSFFSFEGESPTGIVIKNVDIVPDSSVFNDLVFLGRGMKVDNTRIDFEGSVVEFRDLLLGSYSGEGFIEFDPTDGRTKTLGIPDRNRGDAEFLNFTNKSDPQYVFDAKVKLYAGDLFWSNGGSSVDDFLLNVSNASLKNLSIGRYGGGLSCIDCSASRLNFHANGILSLSDTYLIPASGDHDGNFSAEEIIFDNVQYIFSPGGYDRNSQTSGLVYDFNGSNSISFINGTNVSLENSVLVEFGLGAPSNTVSILLKSEGRVLLSDSVLSTAPKFRESNFLPQNENSSYQAIVNQVQIDTDILDIKSSEENSRFSGILADRPTSASLGVVSGDAMIEINANQVNISGKATSGLDISNGIYATSGRLDESILLRAVEIGNVEYARVLELLDSSNEFWDADIEINADMLSISDKGRIETSSSGIYKSSKAGDIRLNIGQSILLDNSDIIASTTGSGDAGSIALSSNNVSLTNGAKISSSSSGPGLAGDINIIDTNRLEIIKPKRNIPISDADGSDDDAAILTSSTQSGGGNVTIEVRDYIGIVNSDIVTKAAGDGGNISIDPQLLFFDSARLDTSAVTGNGGQITVQADQIIRSLDTVFDSRSQAGVDGEVAINGVTNQVGQTDTIKVDYDNVSSLLSQKCQVGQLSDRSSFVVNQESSSRQAPDEYRLSALSSGAEVAHDYSYRNLIALRSIGGCLN